MTRASVTLEEVKRWMMKQETPAGLDVVLLNPATLKEDFLRLVAEHAQRTPRSLLTRYFVDRAASPSRHYLVFESERVTYPASVKEAA